MAEPGSTKIPSLYWLTNPEAREILIVTMQDGTRMFPMFSQESYTLNYQAAYGISHDFIVWGNDTAEYVTWVLDTLSDIFDVIMIDPPTTVGAWGEYYTVDDLMREIWRKAESGAAW